MKTSLASKFIAEKIKSMGISHSEAARRTNTNRSNLIAIIYGRRTPKFRTVQLLAEGLDLTRKEEEKLLILAYEDSCEKAT